MIWASAAFGATWRLAGAYDTAALAELGDHAPSYVWEPAPGMTESCGRAKGADGLGVFEAQAVGSGLSPALVLLLERTSGDGALTTEDVRIAVTDGARRVLLQPMVEPRNLHVVLDAPPELDRHAQLARTQLEVEACLEHKTGRGWIGADAQRIRQAFLLEEPLGGERSRKFFGGQLDPVPALLGPPDACLDSSRPPRVDRPADTALGLVPTDVWGASLRPCRSPAGVETLPAEGVITGPDAPGARGQTTLLPLGLAGSPLRSRASEWSLLRVELRLASGPEREEDRVRVKISYQGKVKDNLKLNEDSGLRDLLAEIPHRYPVVSDRFVPLIVPEWQLVEALRRLERPLDAEPKTPIANAPDGVTDAVGRLLSDPSLLSIQVRPEVENAAGTWPNLATVLAGGLGRPYGYTVGLVAGRSPIVLADAEPDWQDNARGQRAREQALLLATFAIVVVGVAAGVRLRDLTTRVPHERAHYWPSLGHAVLVETKANTPGAPGEEPS